MSIVGAQPLSVWKMGSLRVNTDLVSLDIEGKAKGAQSIRSLLDDQDYELMGGYTFGRSLQEVDGAVHGLDHFGDFLLAEPRPLMYYLIVLLTIF